MTPERRRRARGAALRAHAGGIPAAPLEAPDDAGRVALRLDLDELADGAALGARGGERAGDAGAHEQEHDDGEEDEHAPHGARGYGSSSPLSSRKRSTDAS